MSHYKSRSDFLNKNPKASAFAALANATLQQQTITDGAIKLKQGQLEDKKVVIIGSGVGGLTTAYEILEQQSGAQVTILEAQNRTGGRCLSLRTGDTLTEDINSNLFNSKPSKPQVVRFKRPSGDSQPYLNAGPGRIPSSHKRLLSYLKKFSVEIEVYMMNSESNLVQKNESFGGNAVTYRRLDHNTRGWLAQMVFSNAEELLDNPSFCIDKKVMTERINALRSLMISFGELDSEGNYQVSAGTEGFENGKTRAGYTVLPGVATGKVAEALSFDSLLESKFWEGTKFYQPVDFLWQPTLFQPVGGMDQVQHAFSQQVAALGGDIHLNSPVKTIDWDEANKKFKIYVSQVGTEDLIEYEADYCICNLAMPFLSKILSDKLQKKSTQSGFENKFKNALDAVYVAQFDPTNAPGFQASEDGYTPKFLASTSKVGWQADRYLWQGSQVCTTHKVELSAHVSGIEDSEVGVVPIFGGISWTDNEIQQIWYPSSAYQDQKGVLTGAYNFDKIAHEWGKLPVSERLEKARSDASKFNEKFALGLGDGLAIAWQNMPYIKGGWAYWQAVGDANFATKQFNVIAQGTGVYNNDGSISDACFFIVGDQISSLPGWQEGAIAAALNVVSRIARPDLEIAHLANLPDTRLMVEGI
ncbi:flavin monoamine oxidase family protein [Pseudoalteromonas denitrificans]|uniref:Monoamine oxidase n=1 Tax=Pseudoalteromonas denitrificans DSM 6059 TaxID=1123010 RepID=A0A1I1MAH5_9GAMM|nr:FAD-dependent oxidoreductase [Pseudoalteromonas denitrificans]SFC80208.1 monoamine oxidase [Pseudoalteromonas denitrificans DSM 6059]